MHEYLRRIMAAHALGVIEQGTVNRCDVAHDKSCGINIGAECYCDPEITVSTATGTCNILADGTVSQT